MQYRKHYIPLESNPELFTKFVQQLGLSPALAFHDVLSMEDPELLGLVPRPVLALILVFPTTPTYDAHVAAVDREASAYSGSGEGEAVVWFKQTIHNACGLYGILHALSNGDARYFIASDSHLAHLLEACVPLAPHERALVLENDEKLEVVYRDIATQGCSAVPDDPEEEVNYHYVCFVQSRKDSHLYRLDGDRKGPVDLGLLHEGSDMLSREVVDIVQKFMSICALDLGFSLMALGPG
ncbi:ubiquitin carboxyl-terminal hydrolase [Xylariales sp. PMI_506]|nr:ubiquitin carboxyl-terminal hydrolase [Xylariales sp. PMI_506]